MEIGQQILFFLSALGVFNGLILSFYLLYRSKFQLGSQFYLALLSLALTFRIGKSVFYYFFRDLDKIYLQIGLSACFFIGPALLLYISSNVNHKGFISRTGRSHLLILLCIILTAGIWKPYQQFPDIWNDYYIYGIYLSWVSYVVIAGLILFTKVDFKRIEEKEAKSASRWLLYIFCGSAAICLIYNLALFTSIYIVGPLSYTFLLYLIGGIYIYRKLRKPVAESAPKYSNKRIEDNKAQEWLEVLQQLMNANKPFKNPSYKLADLANESGIPLHKLSQLLNDNLGKSFNQFINEYRIEEAKKLIGIHDELSLEGIGYEAGFKSKSSFYSLFKKFTDVTPASYKKQIQDSSRV